MKPLITFQNPCANFDPHTHYCHKREHQCDYMGWGQKLTDCSDFIPGNRYFTHKDFTVPIQVLLTPEEIDKLLLLIQQTGTKVLEFGTFVGGSAKWISKVSKKIITIDDYSGDHTGDAFRDGIEIEAKKNLFPELFNKKVEILKFNSKKQRFLLERRLGGQTFDVVFIDANHDYDHVKNDIEIALNHTRPGGIICGHDYHIDGVKQAVNELLPKHQAMSNDDKFKSIWWYKSVGNIKCADPKQIKVTIEMDGCLGDWHMLTAACYSLYQDHPYYKFRFANYADLHRGAPWGCLCKADKSVKVCYGSAINRSAQTDIRFLPAFYEDLRDKLGLTGHIKTNKPHLYLSPWEMKLPKQIEGDYVVINAGYKTAQEVKHWGYSNYQEVVDWIIKELGLQIVQIGKSNDHHKPLKNTINLIDKTDVRQLVKLIYHSKFGLGPESNIHHLYASHFHTPDNEHDRYAIPFICIASGWNPKGWASYNTEVYLSKQGQLDCCKGSQGCWKSTMNTCVHQEKLGDETIGRCMKMISPEDVIKSIKDYYDGGILT